MKKVKYFSFILVVIFLMTFNVKADDKCAKDELNRLKELAEKIEFSYDYKLNNKKAEFSIKAVNLNSDLRVLIIEDYFNEKYKEFKNNSEHTATLNNFKSGEKVEITIRGYVANRCSGEILKVKTIRLPYYNPFYDEDFCSKNSDFKYCKVLLDKEISENEYKMQLNHYLKEKEKNNGTNNQNNDNKENNQQLLIIIASIVGTLIVIILISTIVVRKRRKNSL